MEEKKESFKDFKKRVWHSEDSLFSILFIIPLTVRVAYLIKKWNLKVDPNRITLFRLIPLFFTIILLLFLAPILGMRELYLVVAILFYLYLFTDWLDGQVARAFNRVSKKGVFLDAIADRTAIIIFITLIVSVGLWTNEIFLIYGGIFIFVIKMFHMMIITKIFYFKENAPTKRGKEMEKIFGGHGALRKMKVLGVLFSLKEINKKYIKIKRWDPEITTPERYFITIMLPSFLIFFRLDQITIYLMYFFVVSFTIFYLIRVRSLLKNYLAILK